MQQIPKEVISKAIEGGYKGPDIEETEALDPLFFQALGRALGWAEMMVSENGKQWKAVYSYRAAMSKFPFYKPTWKYHKDNYFDLLDFGGDTEKFWKELIK